MNTCKVPTLGMVLKRFPDVVWRGGIDLNPLDPADPDTRAWLEALVWPEHQERRERLDDALEVATANPITLVKGSLLDELVPLVSQVPEGVTLVIFHSAVLAYLSKEERDRFASTIHQVQESRPGTWWLSNEGPDVLSAVSVLLEDEQRAHLGGRFVLARNGRPVALTGTHGDSFEPLFG